MVINWSWGLWFLIYNINKLERLFINNKFVFYLLHPNNVSGTRVKLYLTPATKTCTLFSLCFLSGFSIQRPKERFFLMIQGCGCSWFWPLVNLLALKVCIWTSCPLVFPLEIDIFIYLFIFFICMYVLMVWD